MATYLKSHKFFLFVSIIIFVAVACNNKTEEKAAEKDTAKDTTAISTSQTTQQMAGLTGVTLDTLYTDATKFKNLPTGKRIFFVLTYIKPDTVTLSGWPTATGTYEDTALITLKKGAAVTINRDTTYVGNVKLSINEIKRVKDSIATTHATYVLFIPTLSTTYRNHIEYVILLTKDDPALVKTPLTTGTGVTANPSPPKGAN